MRLNEINELHGLRQREKERKERVKRQNAAHNMKYDRISFEVQKGRKKDIAAFAAASGLSVNAFVSGIILDIVDGKKILVDAATDHATDHTN